MGAATTGASLDGVIVSVKVSDAERAVARRDLEVDRAAEFRGGVPEKVRVAASNESQVGSAAPLASVAV